MESYSDVVPLPDTETLLLLLLYVERYSDVACVCVCVCVWGGGLLYVERYSDVACVCVWFMCRFGLIKEHLVEFNQVAIHTAEGSHDMINRVMTKDNIGLAALLETKEAIWENGQYPGGAGGYGPFNLIY